MKMEYLNRNSTRPAIVWEPNENHETRLQRMIKKIEKKYSSKFDDYWSFYLWTVNHISEFWAEVWDAAGIIYSKRYNKVVDLDIPLENIPKWFEGAELNFAENMLKHRNNDIALIMTGEDRKTEKLTFADLFDLTALFAAALRKIGVKKGDIVACYISNREEAVIAMLGAIGIGAIFTGVLPQLGPQAVLNRLTQLEPKVLVTVDGFSLNKEYTDLLMNIQVITDGLPTLKKVIIASSKETSKLKNIENIKNSCFWDDLIEAERDSDGSAPSLKFEQVSFYHPITISFTSGTTGLPKPILHGSSFLLQSYMVHILQADSKQSAITLTVSPAGWVTWNLLISALFEGNTLVLYEGIPYFLSPTSFWDLLDQYKINNVFMPAPVLEEFEKNNIVPASRHDLSNLRYLAVGGSIVKDHSFDFVAKYIKGNFLWSSVCGTTELMAAIFMSSRSIPVYKGEINSILLGCKVECLNSEGKPVWGEAGEFVITKPAPNMPLGIWGDIDGSKYREIYFSKYSGKFLLGDYGYLNPVTKGLVMCGRCDETLKQRGRRFGSSEIYDIVNHLPEVTDSLCVSQCNDKKDERAVLFIKVKQEYHFDQKLIFKIRSAISTELTDLHVPDVIIKTDDIPYSVSGKKMEILVKNIINRKPYNTESVINPESLRNFKDREELRDF